MRKQRTSCGCRCPDGSGSESNRRDRIRPQDLLVAARSQCTERSRLVGGDTERFARGLLRGTTGDEDRPRALKRCLCGRARWSMGITAAWSPSRIPWGLGRTFGRRRGSGPRWSRCPTRRGRRATRWRRRIRRRLQTLRRTRRCRTVAIIAGDIGVGRLQSIHHCRWAGAGPRMAHAVATKCGRQASSRRRTHGLLRLILTQAGLQHGHGWVDVRGKRGILFRHRPDASRKAHIGHAKRERCTSWTSAKTSTKRTTKRRDSRRQFSRALHPHDLSRWSTPPNRTVQAREPKA